MSSFEEDVFEEEELPNLQRRCIFCRKVVHKQELLRFAIMNDGGKDFLLYDKTGRLGGRGYWVHAAHLSEALDKGIFFKVLRKPIDISFVTVEKVKLALEMQLLDYLGLAKRASMVTMGLEKIKEEILKAEKKNKVICKELLFVASDSKASDLRDIMVIRELPVIKLFSRSLLAGALGREDVVYVLIRGDKFVSEVQRRVSDLSQFVVN